MAEAAEEHLLIQLNYPGSGNYSNFIYDGYGECIIFEEFSAGARGTATAGSVASLTVENSGLEDM